MTRLTLDAAREKLSAARRDLGHSLDGGSILDLLADNFDATIDECRQVATLLRDEEPICDRLEGRCGMSGPELAALAAELNVNPYYLAYALATGAESCEAAFDRDKGNHLYISWNDELWQEQADAEGVGREFVSILEGAVDRHIALCASKIPSEVML